MMPIGVELGFLVSALYRNGFEFAILGSVKDYHHIMESFDIPNTSFRKYKPKTDKLSLAAIEPSMYADLADKLQKCPVLVDTADFKWYIDQISSSHNGRISVNAFNWLRMKVFQLSNHISLMEWVSSCRP